MKIYLVIDGDYGVVGIFNSPEIAEEWIDKSSFRYSPNLEEHDLHSYGTGYPKPYRWDKEYAKN